MALNQEPLVDPDMPPYEWYNKTDYLTNYTVILPFEANWDRLKAYAWYRRHGKSMAYIGAAVYVLMIYVLQKIMARRQRGYDLRSFMIVYNFGLAIFSMLGLVRIYGEAYRSVVRHSFAHSVCTASWSQDQVVLQWMKFFCFSKYIELMDTVFLILRKRPVRFIHWYHHGSVLVFTWHGMHTLTAAGRWFAVMNYTVHIFLYSYYGWHALGYKCPRWVSMGMTSIQLLQMVVGVWIGYIVLNVKLSGGQCHQTWENLYMAIVVYGSFLVLFLRYFYKTYIEPRKVAYTSAIPCAPDNDQQVEHSTKEEYKGKENGHIYTKGEVQVLNGDNGFRKRPVKNFGGQ